MIRPIARSAAALLLLAAAIALTAPALAAAYITTTTVTSLNAAPVAENLACETYRGVAVTGLLRSMDPEGDGVAYTVTTKPKKGDVTIDGDVFTYTPFEGKKGRDVFRYAAIDDMGNMSGEATVTVTIKKQSTSVAYSDMAESDAWYAATVLAERGIFVGERLGGEYLFSPDRAVTRGEFLAMCVNVAGGELVGGISRTGFSDDGDIPRWQKPYVATAVMLDIISGKPDDDGRLVFSAHRPITFAEATVMLDNALAITDVAAAEMPEACPVWAAQSTANLESVGIPASFASAYLTREDAARLLLGAVELVDKRGGTLLAWAEH